jgi:hypothetical protein
VEEADVISRGTGDPQDGDRQAAEPHPETRYLPVGPLLGRRQFLILGGGAAAYVVVASRVAPVAHLGVLRPASAQNPAIAPTLTVSVIRREDLVHVTFLLYNLHVSGGSLVRVNASNPAYLAVQLPGQHVFEQAIPNPSGPPPPYPPSPPLKAVLAGTSQLVFSVPASVSSIPFTLASLLTWTNLTPSLSPSATTTTAPGPSVKQPTAVQTAIEIPWNLVLSPDASDRWVTSSTPVTQGGRTELWHARLAGLVGTHIIEPPDSVPLVRAIWSPDYPGNVVGGDPFQLWAPTSLSSNDRSDLVKSTAAWNLKDIHGNAYVPTPAQVSTLLVSALGASMDVAGSWPTAPTVLKEWRQRTYLGRDTYVKRVYFGYLFPTGHPATLTVIGERQFLADSSGAIEAYLVERQFVTVRQPIVDYTAAPYTGSSYSPWSDRGLPFQQIQAITLSTRDLSTTTSDLQVDPSLNTSLVFWIVDSTHTDVPWQLIGTDWAGNHAHFSAPLIFVAQNGGSFPSAFDPGTVATVASAYDAAPSGRRDIDMAGQPVAFAPSSNLGDTTLPVTTLHLSSFPVASGNATSFPDTPWWVTTMFNPPGPGAFGALVTMEAVDGLATNPAGLTPIGYQAAYLTGGFGPAEVWAQVITAPTVSFTADRSGGVAVPNLSTNDMGISRMMGVVTNAGGWAASDPMFDPSTMFDSGTSTLLGALHISDVTKGRPQSQDSNIYSQTPTITVEFQQGSGGPEGVPTAKIIHFHWTYNWKYELGKGGQTTDPLGLLGVSDQSKLTLDMRIALPISPAGPSAFTIDGEFDNFKIVLFGNALPFLKLSFDSLKFHLQTGKGPDIDPEISGVEFQGALTFINTFAQFLGSGDNGPQVKPTPTGITAGYTLPLPDLAAGVITIKNMKLSAQLTIPFSGDLITITFAFCEKEHPFLLGVWIFGGGGYVSISLALAGLVELDVALEFGVTAQLDFGVAAGGCHVLAGIYLKVATTFGADPKFPSHQIPTAQQTQLEGYFRAGGELEVLGIISMSIELYIGLGYLDPGKAYGKASITLKITVLFFSASVQLEAEKRFGGEGGDPNFASIMASSDWSTYCGAFTT